MDKMNPGRFLALEFFTFTHLSSQHPGEGACVDISDRWSIPILEVEEERPQESRVFP